MVQTDFEEESEVEEIAPEPIVVDDKAANGNQGDDEADHPVGGSVNSVNFAQCNRFHLHEEVLQATIFKETAM